MNYKSIYLNIKIDIIIRRIMVLWFFLRVFLFRLLSRSDREWKSEFCPIGLLYSRLVEQFPLNACTPTKNGIKIFVISKIRTWDLTAFIPDTNCALQFWFYPVIMFSLQLYFECGSIYFPILLHWTEPENHKLLSFFFFQKIRYLIQTCL